MHKMAAYFLGVHAPRLLLKMGLTRLQVTALLFILGCYAAALHVSYEFYGAVLMFEEYTERTYDLAMAKRHTPGSVEYCTGKNSERCLTMECECPLAEFVSWGAVHGVAFEALERNQRIKRQVLYMDGPVLFVHRAIDEIVLHWVHFYTKHAVWIAFAYFHMNLAWMTLYATYRVVRQTKSTPVHPAAAPYAISVQNLRSPSPSPSDDSMEPPFAPAALAKASSMRQRRYQTGQTKEAAWNGAT
jgi:hypothetical protein